MHLKKITLLVCFTALVFGMAMLSSQQNKAKQSFHTESEKALFANRLASPIGPGDYFLTATRCKGCHGYDSLGMANVNAQGVDINLVDDWQTTMMANSSKDPFWRAKVSHEILVNPSHILELQDKCTSCHAPMGNYTSKYKGFSHYTIATLMTDSLGLDGVSCSGCHTIADSARLGSVFSGTITYDTTRNEYGPFTSPMQGPMVLYEGFRPVYSDHMNMSKVCSACHTLITNTVDLNGNYTGGSFVEQATYHEWLNSAYPVDNITCQNCHMPKVLDGVVIANDNQALQPRSPFNEHVFAGANVFMLNVLKNNKNKLGIEAADRLFDSTITATTQMLQKKALSLDLVLDSVTSDSAFFKIKLENKAGHKFPSGYPSRRAVLQFVVLKTNGDTVFQSGVFNDDFSVRGETVNFEPHHAVISQNNEPQIYELVMGDVNHQFTSVLERSAFLLKDNRIPPVGFTTSFASYDTTKISSDALADPDFNKSGLTEGTGIDYMRFHVPVAGLAGQLKVKTKVYYQSVPPKWLKEMFTFTSAEIDTFKTMYNAANKTPVLVAEDSILNVALISSVASIAKDKCKVWPTVSEGRITISLSETNFIEKVEVFNSEGKLELIENQNRGSLFSFNLPDATGIYLLRIQSNKEVFYKKVYKH